jgi:hypothetical protein
LLTVVLTVIIVNTPTLATVFPGSDGVPKPPSNQATFIHWLKSTGWPITSRYRGYPACYETWRDYRLLVYGRPSEVRGNRYDKKSQQYAYLGYSYDELVVTNSFFPDDSRGGVTRSNPWQWKELDMGQSARISWARLSDRQKAFIRGSALTYRGNSYGGMTFKGLGLTDRNTVVLAQPSWHQGFALYTNHYRPGTSHDLRYATFNGSGAGDVAVTADIELLTPPSADGCYVIDAQADEVVIPYRMSGRIQSYTGLASNRDVRFCGAGHADAWVVGRGDGPWSVETFLRVNRNQLDEDKTAAIVLESQAWVVSHQGDISLARTAKTINIRAEDQDPPLTVDVDIVGAIRYFNGRTNCLGRILPANPLRFLGLEKLRIILQFNRTPGTIICSFGDIDRRLTGRAGETKYEISLLAPLRATTMDWDGHRLQPPVALRVRATELNQPAKQVEVVVPGIEITGTIYDIAHLQIGY